MLAAAALMTGVTGCSNDDNVGEVPDNGDATLVIKLPSNVVGMGSRAIEAPVADQSETTLENVSVFMLNAGAVVDTCTFTQSEISAGEKRIEQVAATINRVIVVANIPTAADSTALYGYSNAAAILSHPYSTASQNAPAAAAGINGKVLVGDANVADSIDTGLGLGGVADGHTYKEATVTLNALTARFEIGTVKRGTGVAEVELIGVWINKFYKDGSRNIAEVINKASTEACWTTTPPTLSGAGSETDVDWGNPITMGTPWAESEYHDVADTTAVKLEANSKVYAYQVFAGENIPQLILLVRGKYASGYFNDATDECFFGYVTFTKFIEGGSEITEIEANTIYKIGVGATGIEIIPEIITPKPNLKDIDLGIKVKVAPWTEKTVTPSV